MAHQNYGFPVRAAGRTGWTGSQLKQRVCSCRLASCMSWSVSVTVFVLGATAGGVGAGCSRAHKGPVVPASVLIAFAPAKGYML